MGSADCRIYHLDVRSHWQHNSGGVLVLYTSVGFSGVVDKYEVVVNFMFSLKLTMS